MNLRRCDYGHWYDIEKHGECPVCNFALLETHSKKLMIDDSRTLYQTIRNSHVIALSENEAAKIFDSKSEMELEVEKMRFANSINDLVVKFIRADIDKDNEDKMLVMERFYPLEFRAFELKKRSSFFERFKSQLLELHNNGFVFRDLCATCFSKGRMFPNVILTNDGIRLIDVGISALRGYIGEKRFIEYVEAEIKELESFKEYFESAIA